MLRPTDIRIQRKSAGQREIDPPLYGLPEVVYDTLRWYLQHVETFLGHQEAQAPSLDDQVHFAVFANGAYGMIDHLNLVRP